MGEETVKIDHEGGLGLLHDFPKWRILMDPTMKKFKAEVFLDAVTFESSDWYANDTDCYVWLKARNIGVS